ncbi:MAG: hypothetical protein PWP76_658 [Candidatus Diapherotrites archaeon]|nr:hypothetical protein [Candidatus Diapherotrites archaeon]MDN5367015.1 hypothetical protein [Candidatus Diapherotrites archaeon]
MRGFVLFLEGLLAFLILVAFLLQFFVPLPDTQGIVSFVQKNDDFTAALESGVPPPYPPYLPGMECEAVRYSTATSPLVTVTAYCVK